MRPKASAQSKTITGSDAIIVESHQRPVGSYCCCHPPLISGSCKMTMQAMITTTVRMMPIQSTEPELADTLRDDCEAGAVPAMQRPPERRRIVAWQPMSKRREHLT